MFSVSKCANPHCSAEFKRLGEGRLYARPIEQARPNHAIQKTVWLCSHCLHDFELHFDRGDQIFMLVKRSRVA